MQGSRAVSLIWKTTHASRNSSSNFTHRYQLSISWLFPLWFSSLPTPGMSFIVIIIFSVYFFFQFLLTPNQTLGLPLSGAFFAENENHSSLKNGFRCFYFPKDQVFSTIFLESRFRPKRWKTVFRSLHTQAEAQFSVEECFDASAV